MAKRKDWKIEKTFLVLASIIGVLYVLAIPIGRVPDEESHFFRVYEITSGHFISDTSDSGSVGSMEPKDIEIVRNVSKENATYYDVISNLPDQADEEEVFVKTSADSYNFISYFPQVVGMFIGKVLGLPFLISAYLARLFNLACCIAMLYFSIKYIPFFKEIIFFLAFLPITMQSLAALSTDALITAAGISLISFVLYSTYSLKTTFKPKHYFAILPICILISITKIVYAPLCLLLFAIPKERFGSLKRKIVWIISLGVIVIAAYLIWRFVAPPIRNASDPSIQISSILQNPAYFIAIIFNSISENSLLYFTGTLGGHLEWFNVNLSMLYIFSAFTIFVLLCAKARRNYTITKPIKLLSIAIFSFITFLIFTALYISWTKVGESIIDGVQGRYFLPIVLLIPIICLPITQVIKRPQKSKSRITKTIQTKSQNYYLYAFLIFESVYAITTIACTHL